MIETQNLKFLQITPPGAIVDNAALATTEIDTLGYNYLSVIVGLGALDIAVTTLKLQQSDTTGTGFADVTGGDFSVSPATLPGATADNNLYCIHVNLLGKKRFFDLSFTAGDGSAGTYAYALGILSRAKELPNTAAKRGFAQELFC